MESPYDRFCLITGCGEGEIGHALAQRFFESGLVVFATLLSHEAREHLNHYLIHIVDLNVTSEEDTLAIAKQVQLVTGGQLDILVNNTGMFLMFEKGYTMTADDTDDCQAEKMFAVNVFGPMRMAHQFHRILVNAKGIVVNIGSIGSPATMSSDARGGLFWEGFSFPLEEALWDAWARCERSRLHSGLERGEVVGPNGRPDEFQEYQNVFDCSPFAISAGR
ncbi:short chain dehydrogenase [Apiospora phragmitis]|uniref:Short chain dehydrogenase n=1 Tax=Apiospora phragmitis TaxID=2905665 RepID=A0ABR1VG46_9PEZI